MIVEDVVDEAAARGNGVKSKADEEDIDALLAELEAPKQPAAESAGRPRRPVFCTWQQQALPHHDLVRENSGISRAD